MSTDYTTLLIKLPPELKGSFQGLCKARGVSMNEELRRFMADEVASAATGMTTGDRKTVKKMPKIKKQVASSTNRGSSRCEDTGELFPENPKKPSQARTSASFSGIGVSKQDKLTKATDSKIGLSSAIKSAMKT